MVGFGGALVGFGGALVGFGGAFVAAGARNSVYFGVFYLHSVSVVKEKKRPHLLAQLSLARCNSVKTEHSTHEAANIPWAGIDLKIFCSHLRNSQKDIAVNLTKTSEKSQKIAKLSVGALGQPQKVDV